MSYCRWAHVIFRVERCRASPRRRGFPSDPLGVDSRTSLVLAPASHAEHGGVGDRAGCLPSKPPPPPIEDAA